MKALKDLPNGYEEIFSVNLQKDKKVALLINTFAIILTIIMAVPMHFHVSVLTLFSMEKGLGSYSIRFIALLLLIVAYMILHEFVHAIAMKLFGTKKVNFGFTGLYAFAGSDDYYNKRSYIIIALAPVVIWGIILGIINAFVPEDWFWVIYFIQISNISGAAGDIYVTAKFSKFPKDILIKDSGVGMTVYSKETVKH
ncbi:MAG: DUF3267 domain-containing protein [Clostridia bacterium]|nr:DUF3267 domain-containing protein [Clostridia bacterium]